MNSKHCWRLGALLPLSLGCLLQAHAAGWEEKHYNPMPAADDVVLPMPCDGAMVFRKVFDIAMFQCVDRGSGGHAHLPHAAAEHFPQAVRFAPD